MAARIVRSASSARSTASGAARLRVGACAGDAGSGTEGAAYCTGKAALGEASVLRRFGSSLGGRAFMDRDAPRLVRIGE